MTIEITSIYLARNLDAVLDRVQLHGETFIVYDDGTKIARIAPARDAPGITADELVGHVGNLAMPGEGFADDLEATLAAQGLAEFSEWPDDEEADGDLPNDRH